MVQDEPPVHIRIGDHARGVGELANQVADRRAKLRLIGLALGLLEVMEMTAPREPGRQAAPVPRAMLSR